MIYLLFFSSGGLGWAPALLVLWLGGQLRSARILGWKGSVLVPLTLVLFLVLLWQRMKMFPNFVFTANHWVSSPF